MAAVPAPRFKRRIPVRFWKPEEAEPRSAYTTNISLTGMFIATLDPSEPGTRLRIELPEQADRFAFQADVVHASRVAPSMLKVRPSGMGVRLLSLREMITSVIGSEASADGGHGLPAPGIPDSNVFPIFLQDARDFLEVYERELRYGEVFIPTDQPRPMHDLVRISIDPPLGGGEPVELEARVVQSVSGLVHRLDPSREAGMVVVFSDPRQAEARFREIRRALR
jgi:Tfp pilus assembly protein PilZ